MANLWTRMHSSLHVLMLVVIVPNLHVEGHAFIFYPPLRGGTAPSDNNGYCPQCLGSVKLPMPVCGSKKLEKWSKGPVTQLKAGSKFEVQVKVTAHHKGHFIMRLCDKQVGAFDGDAETCFNARPLRRARPEEVHSDCKPNDRRGDCIPFDEANPSYWYLPPIGMGDSMQSAGADWADSDADRSEQTDFVEHEALVQLKTNLSGSDHLTSGTQAGANYHFHYWIPDDVSCNQCTIQWRWQSANSCTPHEDAYACYFQKMKSAGWDADSWCSGACTYKSRTCPQKQRPSRPCGEEFANCADVSISAASPTPSTPKPRPSPVPPVPSPPSPVPPLDCTDCKQKCQATCSSDVAINQCWGSNRYIECKCKNGVRHSFSGCKCEHSNCPKAAPGPRPNPTPEPEPEPKPEPEPQPEPEPMPLPEPSPTPWKAKPEHKHLGITDEFCMQCSSHDWCKGVGHHVCVAYKHASLGVDYGFCSRCTSKIWCTKVVDKLCAKDGMSLAFETGEATSKSKTRKRRTNAGFLASNFIQKMMALGRVVIQEEDAVEL